MRIQQQYAINRNCKCAVPPAHITYGTLATVPLHYKYGTMQTLTFNIQHLVFRNLPSINLFFIIFLTSFNVFVNVKETRLLLLRQYVILRHLTTLE